MSSATSASAIAMLNVRGSSNVAGSGPGHSQFAHQAPHLEHQVRLDDEVDVAERAAR